MAKRILIIEDNVRNRKLERDLLNIAGYEVLEAEDATTGIALAKKEIPDLILMDIRLPDLRGVEAARLLRQNEFTCDIPIVFVTASAMLGEEAEVCTFPRSGYITKPINTRTFVKELEKVLKES
jgi:CheY-like chemotaxis protein